ncbi:hypothetical protein Q3G72_030296 [Acer saccharum]|nr:hypothetical protein Q3G72_030296 [Acer saccharum]
MVHLAVHLPIEAKLAGPVTYRWMYPFERYLGTLKKYVRNKAKPEGFIAEAYLVNEALTFCSMYLDGIEIKFNPPKRNMTKEKIDKNVCCRYSIRKLIPLVQTNWLIYLKTNCVELIVQAQQVFYVDDYKFGTNWKVVQYIQHSHLWDIPEMNDTENSQDTNDVYQENESSDIQLMVQEDDLEIG